MKHVRKHVKRSLAMLLTVIVLIGMLPVGVLADTVSADSLPDPYTNSLTYGKEVWVSGNTVTEQSTVEGAPVSGAPANVVDADTTTRWHSNTPVAGDYGGSFTVGSGDNEKTITPTTIYEFGVDLGKATLVKRVRVESATDTGANDKQTLCNFKIQYSSDKQNWETALTVEGQLVNVYAENFSTDITARYFRILMPGTNACQDGNEPRLGEFHLFADVQELYPNSLTLGKTATASASVSSNEAPEKAVDGNPLTKWCTTVAKTDENGDSAHWLQVDLGAVYTVGSCLVETMADTGKEEDQTISNFKIQYWDGTAWQNAHEVTGNTQLVYESEFTPVTAQKFRLWLPGTKSCVNDNYPRLGEFHLYSASPSLTILRAALAKLDNYIEENYTAESWEAVAAAKVTLEALVAGYANVSEEEAQEAADALDTALAKLEEKPAELLTITNVTASTWFSQDQVPANVIDGAADGLNHIQTPNQSGGGCWQPNDTATGHEDAGGSGSNDTNPWITLDLGEVKNVGEMYIWNGYQTHASTPGRSLKAVKIEYSTDGITWSILRDPDQIDTTISASYTYVLAEAGAAAYGATNLAGDKGPVLMNKDARYVRISFTATPNVGNYGGDGYLLAEVMFTEGKARTELQQKLYNAYETYAVLNGNIYTESTWNNATEKADAVSRLLKADSVTEDAANEAIEALRSAIASLRLLELGDVCEWDFSDSTGFAWKATENVQNVTLNGSVSGGRLSISGNQGTAGKAYGYYSIFEGTNVEIEENTKLTYVINPTRVGSGDYRSLHVALDLKMEKDGAVVWLRDSGIYDENHVLAHPNKQGEALAMVEGFNNLIIVPLGKYAGWTVTEICVGYDNENGVTGSFTTYIDDIYIGASKRTYEKLTDYVWTTRGSDSSGSFSRGLTPPFTALPHAFNLWTAENSGGNVMYNYNSNAVKNFACSHRASHWLVEPAKWTFAVTTGSGSDSTSIDHDNEIAKVHYYSVVFDKTGSGRATGTQVEMSPTDHGLAARFTYDKGVAKNGIIVDSMTIDQATGTFSGSVGGSAGVSRMYVYGSFSAPVTEVSGTTAYFASAESGKTQVTMLVATSFMSAEQAKKNYELEVAGKTFDEVYTEAENIWLEKLSVLQVEGASENDLVNVYTNLARLSLYPMSMDENTGTAEDPVWQYQSPYGKGVMDGDLHYNNGFWDTYRTAWPMYTLLYSDKAADMLDGLLDHTRNTGWIPRWTNISGQNCMVGTSSDIVFGDALLRGIELTDEQWALAYSVGLKDATMTAGAGATGGRSGQQTGNYLGYIPNSTGEGMSWGLSAYLDNYGTAQLAKYLGYTDEYEYLMNTTKNYVNYFDAEDGTGWFKGKTASGEWVYETLDPTRWGGDYTETNGWGMAFSVPHDGQGLANLYGGKDKLAQKLDDFFNASADDHNTGSYGSEIHEIKEARQVKMGQFQLSNQPAYHIPYMYLYAGRPDRTQETVRQALRQCFTSAQLGGGLIGDEDNGAGSSMYLWYAMGLYPLNMGTGELVFGSPLFTKVTIKLDNGNTLTLSAPNNSPENIYINGVTINGTAYDKVSILQTELTKQNTTVVFDMVSTPSDWGKDTTPTSVTKDDKVPNPKADFVDATASVTCAEAASVDSLFDNNSGSNTTLTPADGKIEVYATFAEGHCVSMYTLSSGTTTPTLASIKLYGSDDGQTWKLLDERTNESFAWTTQVRPFSVPEANRSYYSRYKLEIAVDSAVVLSEIEFMGNDEEPVTKEILAAAVEAAEALNLKQFDEATRLAIEEAIEAANEVLADSEATPEEINEAYLNLIASQAIIAVRAELQKLYDTYSNANLDIYSEESCADLEEALDAAKDLLDNGGTEAEMKAAGEALKEAASNLKPDYAASLNYYDTLVARGGSVSANGQTGDAEAAYMAMDGIAEGGGVADGSAQATTRTKWCSTTSGNKILTIDLGAECTVESWLIMHAGREGSAYITSDYHVEYSTDNATWNVMGEKVSGNTQDLCNYILEEPVTARYFRLVVTKECPNDKAARIYEFHLYGTVGGAEEPKADLTALNAAIAAAEALVEADYTAESWAAMQTALEAAKALNEASAQADVDAAAAALNAAVAALVEKADLTALNAAIAAAEALVEADYTAESWAAMQTALEAAKALDAEDAQADVDAAAAALSAAIEALVEKPVEVPVDKAALAAAIEVAEALTENDYTAESWAVLAATLEDAKTIYADEAASQENVDAAVAALNAAIAGLKKPSVPVTPIVPVRPIIPVIGGAVEDEKGEFPFIDVPATAWFYDEVKEAWENDLINGVTATLYKPDETLTVAQAIKLAAALHQMYFEGEVTLENGAPNWYDSYVDYAIYNGIIEAKYDTYTLAQMNAPISREEFVHIFFGAMPISSYYACNNVADNAIPDVKMTDDFADEIYTFYRAGILTGSDGQGTFHPESSIKRSEVAAILIRMYDTNVRQAVTLG